MELREGGSCHVVLDYQQQTEVVVVVAVASAAADAVVVGEAIAAADDDDAADVDDSSPAAVLAPCHWIGIETLRIWILLAENEFSNGLLLFLFVIECDGVGESINQSFVESIIR